MSFTLAKGARVLNQEEVKKIIEAQEKHFNALGYEASITTLTTKIAAISEQKFYNLPFADYVPVQVGEGAWSSNLLTYRSYHLSGNFAKGIQNTGTDNGRLVRADAAVDSVVTYVHNWATETGWTIMDLEMASKSGNWDLITEKEVSRKTNWDLGLQSVAFNGLDGDANFLGLLNQPAAINTSVLTNSLTSLAATPATLSSTIAAMLTAYRVNVNHTAYPNRFVIPESDYNGMATASSPSFPLISIKEYIEKTFKELTKQSDFQILPLADADASVSLGSNQIYSLYRHDAKSIRMNVPVPYTTTLPNSMNNFAFSCVGYGTFTGVTLLRPKELLYFQFPASNLS